MITSEKGNIHYAVVVRRKMKVKMRRKSHLGFPRYRMV
jgi:ribosomal protein L14